MSDDYTNAPAPADRATCQRHIEAAKEFPYDGVWKDDELQTLRHAEHRAYQVARGILHNFSDRRGIKWALRDVDHDVREEIVDTVALFIREDEKRVLRDLIEKADAEATAAREIRDQIAAIPDDGPWQEREHEYANEGIKLRRALTVSDWLKSQMEEE